MSVLVVDTTCRPSQSRTAGITTEVVFPDSDSPVTIEDVSMDRHTSARWPATGRAVRRAAPGPGPAAVVVAASCGRRDPARASRLSEVIDRASCAAVATPAGRGRCTRRGQ